MITPVFIQRTNQFLAKAFPVDYEEYLKTEKWKAKSDAAKRRALWQCQSCGRPSFIVKLSTHHRTYVRLGWEIPEDLVVFCAGCHAAVTRLRKRIYADYTVSLSR